MTVDLRQPYDRDNIFARIVRHEIPAEVIYENEYALAFPDINPQAPVHVLIIPKGSYISASDFGSEASEAEIVGFARAISAVAAQLGLSTAGYRIISNSGPDAGQEVPHYHVHLLAGERLRAKLIRNH